MVVVVVVLLGQWAFHWALRCASGNQNAEKSGKKGVTSKRRFI